MKKGNILAIFATILLVLGCTQVIPLDITETPKPDTPSNETVDIEMVFVEGGTFTMGATEEQGNSAEGSEKPAHQVTLSDFYIGKYEVTQAQWEAIMGSNPSNYVGNVLPVENVSWNDIQEFVTKLNEQTGKNFRLPTEAEWEYAARGGNKSQGYKYSGGNNVEEVAWYNNNSGKTTHPVGHNRSNELGIYDMSGNVLEWCSDWYDSYSSDAQTNPTGPTTGSNRVARGGSCNDFANYCRVSYRSWGRSDYRGNNHGFRLACSTEDSGGSTDTTTQPNNEIWYTSTDGNIVTPYSDGAFGANIVSNTYSNGKGVIKFDGDVTIIGSRAFRNCSNLASMIIPNGVTKVDKEAFYSCSSLAILDGKFASTDKRCLVTDGTLISFAPAELTEYTIPNGVTSIGDYAFAECTNLVSVTIPNSVSVIKGAAFISCSNLKSVTLSENLTSIGENAFRACSNLESFTLPNGVTSIGNYVLYGCNRLTSITIPDSVIEIGAGVFNGCSNLSEFNGKFASADKRCLINNGTLISFAPAGLTAYTIPNSITSVGNCAFRECTALTSVIIPNSVTTIEDSAFYKCTSLTSVTIPESVTKIGAYAFAYFSTLNVYCKPTTPPTGDISMFLNNKKTPQIYVPTSAVSAYKAADGWSTYADAIVADPATTGGETADFGDFEMVFVEGGTFTMGATSEQGSDAGSDEKPAHQVTVSDFYIGKYEVTQAQWRAVMGSNPSYFTGDNLPVEQVSWDDIQEFITKLNEQTGKNFRLPTEAEWEYAARGGNKSQGYKYSGSNTIDDVAWYWDNSSSTTHPVGQKLPNELGLYDMSGNVWEWCYDWYGSYSSDAQTNPTGPSIGSYRVLRGGSWGIYAWNCRVSFRFYYSADLRDYSFGFRLVCSPE